jgi:NADH:ubiquinone oxidoreductase subunit E
MNEADNPRMDLNQSTMIHTEHTANEIEIEIVICMGSSCFSRGNKKIVPIIESFFQSFPEKENVKPKPKLIMKGSMCENQCKSGPNVKINGIRYQLQQPEDIIPLLKHIINEKGE